MSGPGNRRVNLTDDVDRFVIDVDAALAALSGRPIGSHAADVLIEASNVIGAVIDADGRQAGDELDGFLDALGPRLDPPLRVTSVQLRESELLDGRRTWLDRPSVLFDLLVKADARSETTRSHDYYAHVMRLCHVTAAIDLVPSADEIAAIDQFRTMLLRAMDAAGVPRPGQPRDRTGSPPPPSDRPAAPTPPSTPTSSAQAAATTHNELPPARSLDDLLAELDRLVGLDHVKAEVRRLTSLLHVQQLREERGLPTVETSHHLVFTGNPGTGKTTVARLLSQIYRTVGVTAKGHLVETDRSRLVAGFVGQTAIRTAETLESALGGMLLIDEAYALARGGENDFGLEAIDTIVKFMEDHRDDLAIVAAGYTEEMATFIDANPGLKSRFTKTIHFPDYTSDELVEIFLQLGERHHYLASDDALAQLRHLVEAEPRSRGFGNARFVRNLFETAVAHQAQRIAHLPEPTDEQLETLVAADIVAVDA